MIDKKIDEFRDKFCVKIEIKTAYKNNEIWCLSDKINFVELENWIRKALAEAEKNGMIKLIENLKEKKVTHEFQIKSSRDFCQGLKVAVETSEKKLKELGG